MPQSPLSQAVNNNALWCNTVCQSHGNNGEFLEGLWINRHKSPPFYPNAVTLAGAEMADEQRQHIVQLLNSNLTEEWAVKDSFSALDLSNLNFSLLFEAKWIYRNACTSVQSPTRDDIHCDIIQSERDLLEWETAWYGTTEGDHTRIFLPALLKHQHIAIIAARQKGAIIGGAIASQNAGAVGISNLFYPEKGSLEICGGCIEKAAHAFPGLTLVGYETSEELEIMHQLGFESIGDLRVWLKNKV